MHRSVRTVAVTVAGAAGLLVAGCTLPDGVDGDLTNTWDTLPEPVGFVPEVGACHPQDYQQRGSLADYQPIGCDQPHRAETVYIGEFSGEADGRAAPPSPGSTEWRAAFQQCEQGAAEFLGADFRYGRLRLTVTVPSAEAWNGGARWLRCDVSEVDDGDAVVERQGSLAAVLETRTELSYACSNADLDENDNVNELIPVDCDEPHDTEFVGVFQVADDVSYPFGQDVWDDQVHPGCRELVGDFADVRQDRVEFVTGTIGVPPTGEDFDNGDRGVRCHLWLDGDRDVSESLEGRGEDAFPDLPE